MPINRLSNGYAVTILPEQEWLSLLRTNPSTQKQAYDPGCSVQFCSHRLRSHSWISVTNNQNNIIIIINTCLECMCAIITLYLRKATIVDIRVIVTWTYQCNYGSHLPVNILDYNHSSMNHLCCNIDDCSQLYPNCTRQYLDEEIINHLTLCC